MGMLFLWDFIFLPVKWKHHLQLHGVDVRIKFTTYESTTQIVNSHAGLVVVVIKGQPVVESQRCLKPCLATYQLCDLLLDLFEPQFARL